MVTGIALTAFARSQVWGWQGPKNRNMVGLGSLRSRDPGSGSDKSKWTRYSVSPQHDL